MSVGQRIVSWFGIDDDYVRPVLGPGRSDLRLALVLLILTAVNRELQRPLLGFPIDAPIWLEYLVQVVAAGLIVWRRRMPLVTALIEFLLFYLACNFVPGVGYTLAFQAFCFVAIYSAAARAQNRIQALIALGAILILLLGWLSWSIALGAGLDSFAQRIDEIPDGRPGLLPPITSLVLHTFLLNIGYVLGATALGCRAWWQARDQAVLQHQAATIRTQSAELQRQAVVDERLRIARELHDVVAHHISAMGIQAGAARMLLERAPDQARAALQEVESSSRLAVTEMRSLLGALRGAAGQDDSDSRAPEPTLAQLPELLDQFRATGLQVELAYVEQHPNALAEVPLPLQLSVYRIVSEALTNVQRHSSAQRARVVLRSESSPNGWVEAEILDNGRPLPGTSGSCLGQLGIRERVASHDGLAEIGPRATGGYRVRVRLPLHRDRADTTRQ